MQRKKGSIKDKKGSAGKSSEERQSEEIRALGNIIYEKKKNEGCVTLAREKTEWRQLSQT